MASDERYDWADDLASVPTFRATFSHRLTTRRNNVEFSRVSDLYYDLPALLTCAADLYAQNGVLEMGKSQTSTGSLKQYASGATSQIIELNASYTQPSGTDFYKLQEKKLLVVMKKYPVGLFHANGQANNVDMAKCLLTELRVLSHPGIRRAEQIVNVLGLYWDVSIPTISQPVIILEYTSIPAYTKWSLALDVAKGLSVLHSYGVIHGDIKPQNVLIFEDPPRAKLADFGNSVLESDTTSRLSAYTRGYRAPEWYQTADAASLKLTDTFSFGLVFTSLVFGSDYFRFVGGYDLETSFEMIEDFMQSDELLSYILNTIYERDDETLADEFELIKDVLGLTIRKDPQARDLHKVISLLSTSLSTSNDQIQSDYDSVYHRSKSTGLAIPYQALECIDITIKEQAVRAIQHVAETSLDSRQADALWELCVCYSSDFGLPRGMSDNDEKFQSDALKYLVKAAQQGDSMAQVAIAPLFEAFGEDIPLELPRTDWLVEQARAGSDLAKSQLQARGDLTVIHSITSSKHIFGSDGAQETPKTVDPGHVSLLDPLNEVGDTAIHYAASVGDVKMIKLLLERSIHTDISIINNQNSSLETPLLQAARAGHAEVIRFLVRNGADARLSNICMESPLHFAVEFHDSEIQSVINSLATAGAGETLLKAAKESTRNTNYRLNPTSEGTPAERALLAGNLHAFRALLALEDDTAAKNPEFSKTSPAKLRKYLAFAVKLHHVDLIELLVKLVLTDGQATRQIRIWDGGHLRDLSELWLFGSVSTNPESGEDVPERLSRAMRFGSDYINVLESSLAIIVNSGLFSQPYHDMMALAMKHSRYDHVTCLLPYLMEDQLWTTNNYLWSHPLNHQTSTTRHSNVSEVYGGVPSTWLEVYKETAPEQNRKIWAAHESNIPPHYGALASVARVKNHRKAWVLAEWIEYAIIMQYRGIFSLLIRYDAGLALHPGQSLRLKVIDENRVYRDENDTIDYRTYFPPPAGDFRIETTQDNTNFFDGTISYATKYMTCIARQSHRDMSFPLILIGTLKAICPDAKMNWTPQHWFEDLCLGSSTFEPLSLPSPLYHAMLGRWDELVELLIMHGAQPLDLLPLSETSVMGALLASARDLQESLLYTTGRLTKYGVREFLSHRELWTICLHPYRYNTKDEPAFKYYTRSIRWVPHDTLDCLVLSWKRSESLRQEQGGLWNTIHSVIRHQRSFDAGPVQSNLITVAILEQNVHAVKVLMAIGYLPKANVLHIKDVIVSPMDAISWIEAVTTSECDRSGKELKRCFQEIASLIQPAIHEKSQSWFQTLTWRGTAVILGGSLLIILILAMVGFGAYLSKFPFEYAFSCWAYLGNRLSDVWKVSGGGFLEWALDLIVLFFMAILGGVVCLLVTLVLVAGPLTVLLGVLVGAYTVFTKIVEIRVPYYLKQRARVVAGNNLFAVCRGHLNWAQRLTLYRTRDRTRHEYFIFDYDGKNGIDEVLNRLEVEERTDKRSLSDSDLRQAWMHQVPKWMRNSQWIHPEAERGTGEPSSDPGPSNTSSDRASSQHEPLPQHQLDISVVEPSSSTTDATTEQPIVEGSRTSISNARRTSYWEQLKSSWKQGQAAGTRTWSFAERRVAPWVIWPVAWVIKAGDAMGRLSNQSQRRRTRQQANTVDRWQHLEEFPTE